MFWALLSPVYYWAEYGGMFCGPAVLAPKLPEAQTIGKEEWETSV